MQDLIHIKKKLFLGLILFLFFLIVFLFLFEKKDRFVFYSEEQYNEIFNNIVLNKKKNLSIINSVSFNNNECFFDKNSDFFLCYLGNSNNSYFSLNVDSALDYSLFSNSSFTMNYFDTTSVVIYTDKYYYVINLKFTNLPIMNINSLPDLEITFDNYNVDLFEESDDVEQDDSFVSNSYINLVENDYSSIGSSAFLYLHGHDSLNYDKKSYKIELNKYSDGTYLKNDVRLLDMYSDDDWILDAMYVDNSKIRNKFSSDIWRMISNDNVLNSKYIELFINNEYKGLYLLKEGVNSKSLNLGPDDALMKSVLYLNRNDVNVNNVFDKYFIFKYPSEYNYSSTCILNLLRNYYSEIYSSSDMSDFISENYDLDNFLDYRIFIALIKGVDNVEYNNYYLSFKKKDGKIVKTPWDMDLTFGLTFNRTNDYELVNDMGFDIYYSNSPYLNNMIKERYWELRKSKLSFENLERYIDDYEAQLKTSGASIRESDNWDVPNVDDDISKIRIWLKYRLEYLDEYFR